MSKPAWRNRRKPEIPDHAHGTVNGYDNYRCRCIPCREAKKQKMKRYRKRLLMNRLKDYARESAEET